MRKALALLYPYTKRLAQVLTVVLLTLQITKAGLDLFDTYFRGF